MVSFFLSLIYSIKCGKIRNKKSKLLTLMSEDSNNVVLLMRNYLMQLLHIIIPETSEILSALDFISVFYTFRHFLYSENRKQTNDSDHLIKSFSVKLYNDTFGF